MSEKLNIVDENDNIIGEQERSVVHKKGLLHREVHVYFITADKKIIFQRRADDKDTFPGLLDATVGGHVDIGDGYENAAVRETEEETGVKLVETDLVLIGKFRKRTEDKITNTINHNFLKVFVYKFNGNLKDLKIEKGKSVGFEEWRIQDLVNFDELRRKKFIPYVYGFVNTVIVDFINSGSNL